MSCGPEEDNNDNERTNESGKKITATDKLSKKNKGKGSLNQNNDLIPPNNNITNDFSTKTPNKITNNKKDKTDVIVNEPNQDQDTFLEINDIKTFNNSSYVLRKNGKNYIFSIDSPIACSMYGQESKKRNSTIIKIPTERHKELLIGNLFFNDQYKEYIKLLEDNEIYNTTQYFSTQPEEKKKQINQIIDEIKSKFKSCMLKQSDFSQYDFIALSYLKFYLNFKISFKDRNNYITFKNKTKVFVKGFGVESDSDPEEDILSQIKIYKYENTDKFIIGIFDKKIKKVILLAKGFNNNSFETIFKNIDEKKNTK